MRTLITGISGQDGSYLAEHLLSEGHEVFGMVRRNSQPENQTSRINHLLKDVQLYYGDVTDFASLLNVINDCRPEKIYNLAAQSHVQISSHVPVYTLHADALGVLNLLEICKHKSITIYQASSSEMFGNQIDSDGYQRESTKMIPVSPYGCSKLYAHNLCNHYREAYDMNISCGILFNHESERRGINFVTGKVCKGAADIANKKQETLVLGNISAKRDWGYAPDYVKAMTIMENDNYVVATGKSYSVMDLCEVAFSSLGLDYRYYVVVDSKYMRPQELNELRGDASKIRSLGWYPSVSFVEMITNMVISYA